MLDFIDSNTFFLLMIPVFFFRVMALNPYKNTYYSRMSRSEKVLFFGFVISLGLLMQYTDIFDVEGALERASVDTPIRAPWLFARDTLE